MSQLSVVSVANLEAGNILAPERYDPRRTSVTSGRNIRDVATVVSTHLNPVKAPPDAQFVVLDTSNAHEGMLRGPKPPVSASEIASVKKRLQANDVVISRLRPYLRQVALVDRRMECEPFGQVELVCSTEFFVLRAKQDESIAFLVPLLLSAPVQSILAAAQEGGHHPRFIKTTLEAVAIPESLWGKRSEVSTRVVEAIEAARTAELHLRQLVADVSSMDPTAGVLRDEV